MSSEAHQVVELPFNKFIKLLSFEGDPKFIFDTLSTKNIEDMTVLEQKKLMLAVGIGSQYTIGEALKEQMVPLGVGFARQLIEEYGCTTPSEIALAEVAAIAYANHIEASKQASRWASISPWLKEVERTQRRFISALSTLRAMKRPPVTVNVVKAENAFVGQTHLEINKNEHD